MCPDLTDVSTKFQLDWPTNNRIITVSLFSNFSGSLFSKFLCPYHLGSLCRSTLPKCQGKILSTFEGLSFLGPGLSVTSCDKIKNEIAFNRYMHDMRLTC